MLLALPSPVQNREGARRRAHGRAKCPRPPKKRSSDSVLLAEAPQHQLLYPNG
jgi:hypothetical protein